MEEQTRAVTSREEGEEADPLEVIELRSELGARTRRLRPLWTRARAGWAVVVVVACVAVLGVALDVASGRGGAHANRRSADTSPSNAPATGSTAPSSSDTQPSTRGTTPTSHPRGPLLGSFYPVLDHSDTTTLVLPSGLTVTLANRLTDAIGGLGAVFGGLVTPKEATSCCALAFGISRAAPNDLFDTLGANATSIPLLVSAAHAKQADLKQFKGDFGVLSTGDWTLTATFEDGETGPHADATIRKRLYSWHLRSTPYGAVLEIPGDSTIDQAGVGLGATPDLSDRELELTSNVEPCLSMPDTARTINTGNGAVAHWCEHGLLVAVDGPRSYVENVFANLKVAVKPAA